MVIEPMGRHRTVHLLIYNINLDISTSKHMLTLLKPRDVIRIEVPEYDPAQGEDVHPNAADRTYIIFIRRWRAGSLLSYAFQMARHLPPT